MPAPLPMSSTAPTAGVRAASPVRYVDGTDHARVYGAAYVAARADRSRYGHPSPVMARTASHDEGACTGRGHGVPALEATMRLDLSGSSTYMLTKIP
jgi:hypothetical protein